MIATTTGKRDEVDIRNVLGDVCFRLVTDLREGAVPAFVKAHRTRSAVPLQPENTLHERLRVRFDSLSELKCYWVTGPILDSYAHQPQLATQWNLI